MTLKELEKDLGATSLGYLSVEGAMDAVGQPHNTFCGACFTGKYPVDIPVDWSKESLEKNGDVGEIAAIRHAQPSLLDVV